MIILTETTDTLQMVLSGAPSTTQPRCVTCWRDTPGSEQDIGRTLTAANSTTDVTIVSAPAAYTRRVVDYISVFNGDTAAVTVTVKIDANATEYILTTVQIAAGERLEYTDATGFRVLNTVGASKTAVNQGSSPVSADFSTLVLASNVINNNAIANTIADVTGLSCPVVSGSVTMFEFGILYSSAATTTGSRWSLNGPAFSRLVYGSEYSLAATTTTRNANLTAYDLPAGSNATSGTTTSNQAYIWGFIVPSADGDLIARFASEVAGSAITALAGSYVRYQQLN